MLQESDHQQSPSAFFDSGTRYGWISILFHWITAIAVIALWVIGKSILNGPSEETDAIRQLHVSIAVSVWLVLFFRVIWRFRSGHPHVEGVTALVHRIAKSAHYITLIALLLMLGSGPFLVWSSGNSINVFNWLVIPTPIEKSESVRTVAWVIHSNSSMLLLWLTILHVAGALKHLMFHSDDTFVRIFWPGKQGQLD